MILEPDFVDKLYQKWYYGNKLSETRWPKKYTAGNYRDQRFEDWLWNQGFTVVQKDKKRYLKFNGDQRHLTMFLLRWNS